MEVIKGNQNELGANQLKRNTLPGVVTDCGILIKKPLMIMKAITEEIALQK